MLHALSLTVIPAFAAMTVSGIRRG